MPEWISALSSADLAPNGLKPFTHAGKTYVVCRTQAGALHALDGFCTHANVQLSYGDIVGSNLMCPQHGGRFDLATGKCRGGPVTVGLKTYPVKEEDGQVLVEL